jgi:drug/metabolite transporter (DMT)-like permease
MLTLRRFRAMARSYGSDLRRWPAELRPAALALLEADPQARAIVDKERALDGAIAIAGKHFDEALGQPGDAAMIARLRSGVAARIATQRSAQRRYWTPPRYLQWFGMATGCGLAIAAGLVIGSLYAASPGNDPVLALLQPTPLRTLTH